jgi:hypothetical protein
VIAVLLFQASSAVDAYFDNQAIPDIYTQYTAHNVAVLVQTVGRGLVYLLTFIFGANALGLAGGWVGGRVRGRAGGWVRGPPSGRPRAGWLAAQEGTGGHQHALAIYPLSA